MLERYRVKVGPYVERLSRPFARWSPNALSWVAFSFSGAAALAFASLRLFESPRAVAQGLGRGFSPIPDLLFFAALFVFLGGVFDALDGYVARKQGTASPSGDFLDHVLDRYADVVVLLGVAVSGWADPVLVLLALVSLLLVSYMGTQAQAVGMARLYRGLLSRADRLVLLTCAALLLSGLSAWDLLGLVSSSRIPLEFTVGGLTLSWLDLVLLYFVIAGQFTAIMRGRQTWRELKGG